EMPCPTDLAATANAEGTVTLSFTPAPGANATNVYRAEGSGDLELLATIPGGVMGYTDTTTTAGTAYTYKVTAVGDVESTACATVDVSAIPEFPTALAVGLAAGCGLLAYAFVRRKK
ncbi:MAG: hypothetical protein ABR562_03215, partial [Thermoplasmatota archaeon]